MTRDTSRFDTMCTVSVEVTADRCRADVVLDGDVAINPGDKVRVHGDPIRCGIGHSLEVRRTATVERAGPLRRAWTRATGYLALTELYEVSFLPGVAR